jgi:hypothetical protein
MLADDVQIDETYYSVARKDLKLKEDGKKFRGLSRNKICIVIGCDKADHVYCRIEGVGKPHQKNTMGIFRDHIQEGSRIEHDMEKAPKPLVEALQLRSVAYNSLDLKSLPDKENPLDPINSSCRELKTFLNPHKSFHRENLIDYLNLFSFIYNPPLNPHEKIKLILNLILEMPKTLTYRDRWSNSSEF